MENRTKAQVEVQGIIDSGRKLSLVDNPNRDANLVSHRDLRLVRNRGW